MLAGGGVGVRVDGVCVKAGLQWVLRCFGKEERRGEGLV